MDALERALSLLGEMNNLVMDTPEDASDETLAAVFKALNTTAPIAQGFATVAVAQAINRMTDRLEFSLDSLPGQSRRL